LSHSKHHTQATSGESAISSATPSRPATSAICGTGTLPSSLAAIRHTRAAPSVGWLAHRPQAHRCHHFQLGSSAMSPHDDDAGAAHCDGGYQGRQRYADQHRPEHEEEGDAVPECGQRVLAGHKTLGATVVCWGGSSGGAAITLTFEASSGSAQCCSAFSSDSVTPGPPPSNRAAGGVASWLTGRQKKRPRLLSGPRTGSMSSR
jgi:hypothetical protein